MAPPWPLRPARWALAMMASLACPTRCASSAVREPMPTVAQCPHCGFAEWTCTSQCSPLLGIEFNFSHEADGCFEAIPGNDRTLFWDTDAYCIFPEAEEVLGLTCDEMHKYTMDSPYVLHLDRCSLSSTSTMTVLEECHWTCKFGRPFYRCIWTFDPEGEFDHNGVSTLEKCWLVESCTSSFKQKVEAVCRPMDLWTQAGLSELENQHLQEQLMLLGNSHSDAAEELVAALTSAGLSEEDAAAAWDKYNEVVEELKSHAEALSEAGLNADDGSTAGTVVTTVLLNGVSYMLLVGDAEHTKSSEDTVKAVIIEAAGGDYTIDDVMVEFRRSSRRDGSMVIEATLETHGAFTATLVQFNLKRAETLGADILAALQALPFFVADGPVSVGSVKVEVLSQGEDDEYVDLAAQVAAYKELAARQQRDIEDSQEKTAQLAVIIIVMGAVILCLGAVSAALCVARKRSEKVLPPTESNRVVIGRPVGQGEPAALGSVAVHAPAGEKGGAALPAPTGIIDAVPLRRPLEKPGAGSTGGTGLKGLDV